MAGLRAIPRWAIDTLRMALVLAVGLTVFSVYSARGDNHDQTFYACLYAGSFSQINTSGLPANCGRGQQVQWNSQGVDGLPGADGVSGYEVVVETGTAFANGISNESALCTDGKVPIGGGFTVPIGDGIENFYVVDSRPYDPLTSGDYIGWVVSIRNPGVNDLAFDAYAVCAFMAPDPAP